jgi:Ca2+-binding EF-hand superfamily protein
MNAARTSVGLGSPTPPPGAPSGTTSRTISPKLPPILAGGPMMSAVEGQFHWAAAKPKKACQGHNALAKASLWLEADRGERKPAAQVPVTISASSPNGSKDVSKTPSRDRSPPRAVQPRHRRASFDNICHTIAEKATQKFKNTREAFRFIDEDHDGTISQTEMRYFFRAYDFGPEIADSFFEFLDQYGKGEIPYNDFVAFMSPHFNDVRPGSPTLNVEAVQARAASQSPPCPLLIENVAEVHREFAEVLKIIGQKVPSKFPSLRHVWRYVDNDHDGKVSKSELRAFFRAFNLPQEEADKLYDRMDQEGDGEIYYGHFVRYLGPFVAPDATEVSSILKTPKKTKQVVTSPADPSLMRQANAAEPPGPRTSDAKSRSYQVDQDPELRHELKALMIDIGRKLPLKFKHQRDAFRMLDLQRDGRITRTEMRGFFRGFGWGEKVADRMFDMLKEEPHDEVDYKSFMSHFDKIIGPQFRQGKRQPLIEMEDQSIEKEVNDIAVILQDRMTTKYKSVQEAFRAVDLNKDGNVCLHEMKTFFRNIGMSYSQAEKVFAALDQDGSGEIQYDEFIGLFGNQKNKEALEEERAKPLWKIYGGAALCI